MPQVIVPASVDTSGDGGLPNSVITVAPDGTQDYTTIQAAMDAAAAGETVLVYPGTYAESIDFTGIATGVRVTGFPNAQNVVIAGADTTSVRVTMSQTCTLREITVVSPSSGSNPGILLNEGASSLAVTFNVVVQGGGGSGALVSHTGSGTWAGLGGLYHNGGSTTGAFVHLSAGRTIGEGWIANVGSSSDVLLVEGTAALDLSDLLVQPASLYSCTDMLHIASTSTVTLHNVSSPKDSPPSTNGLHIAADGVDINAVGCVFFGATNDVLVASGLVATGTSVIFNACEYRFERLSAPAGYLSGLDAVTVAYMDPADFNDPAFRVGGELSVGIPARPAESTFGTGDSSVIGMAVYTDDGTGTNFTDETAAARTRDSDTFSPQGTAAGAGVIYIGSAAGACTDIRLNLDSVGVPGSADYVVELLASTGPDVWTAVNFMHSDESTTPPAASAKEDVYTATDARLRLNIDDPTWQNWAVLTPTTGPSGASRWLRIRNTGTVTTNPSIERVKLGFSRTEIEGTGFVQYTGYGEQVRAIPQVSLRNTDDLAGASPSNENIDYGSVINITPVDNELQNNTTDGVGLLFRLPTGVDTSRPLTFRVQMAPVSTVAAGDVELEFYYGRITTNTVLNGAQTETLAPESGAFAIPLAANTVVEQTYTADISDFQPGDTFICAFRRVGADAADTYTGGIYIVSFQADALFYR